MPNKFLIETALDIGIANLEKQRRTDPKKLYEEVKSALPGEGSTEIRSLYERYISLYEASLKSSTTASDTLKDEVKWKHIGDLREAVKNNGKGLSLSDIEGLNQFALAEYGRQERDMSQRDEAISMLLKSWFSMYESLKSQSLESMKRSYKDALKEGFLQATKVPFLIRYTEGNEIREVSVTLSGNKIIVGKKEHTLVGDKIQIGAISLDKDSFYIPYSIRGKQESLNEKISKKDFIEKYLDDILMGKDIRIQDYLVRVNTQGEITPRTIGTTRSGESQPSGVESVRETLTLDEAIKKGFSALISGVKIEPITVLQDGKKYRFALEVDQKGFTLGGKKFTMNFPANIKNGSFAFEKDEIIFSGRLRGESMRTGEILRVKKSDVIKELDSKKGEIVFRSDDDAIRISALGSGDYLPKESLITEGTPAGPNIGVRPDEASGGLKPAIELKWPLEAYAGYSEQELRKVGKTIQDLQLKLKQLGHYAGEPTGKYDIATLNAVVAFQKSKTITPDGLVGIGETIPALFGIKPQVGGDRGPESGGPTPQNQPPRPTGVPRPGVRPPEGITESTQLKNLRIAMDEFRKTYKAVSEQSGIIYDTPDEIKRYQASINAALKPVTAALAGLEGKNMSNEAREEYNMIVLEISRYFSDGFSNVKNRHYRNYDLSLDLALSVIKDDLEKQKISLPKPPRTEDILGALKKYNPKLAEKIQADLRSGFELGQILANPRVRGEFEEVYEKVYKEYEVSLQALITKLRDEKTTFTNPSGYKALEMLIFTMGTTDFLDWKARNRDKLYQTLGMVGSTVVGVGAFVGLPFTGGASSIIIGGLASGIVTTAGMVWTKGRGDLDRETLTELGINTVTFGAGGALAKGANIIMRSGTTIAKMSGIGLDAAGGLALGMSADHVRAWEADTNITVTESFRNNWYWALLPLALGMKGSLRAKAEKIEKEVGKAKAQAMVGDKAGAIETLKKVEPQVAELAGEVKTAVPKKAESALPSAGGEIPLNSQYKLHVSPDKTTFKIEDLSTGTFRSTDLPINRLEGELTALKIDAPNIHNQILELNPKPGGATKVEVTEPKPGEVAHTVKPPEGVPSRSIVSDTVLQKNIVKSIDGLKKDGSNSVTIGEYTIKREGSKYRIEGHDGVFVISKKEVLDKVNRGLQGNIDEANAFIRGKVDDHTKSLPAGKVNKYSGPDGAYTMTKKADGTLEVVGPGGKVLEGEALEAFYNIQAGKILDTRMKSLLDLHGDKPIGEVIHGKEWYKMQTFEGWAKWNAERSGMNPVRWVSAIGRWSAEQIFDSLKAPLKTAEAFRSASMRDHWLRGDGRLNGLAKAIVLRDAEAGWISGRAIGTVAVRGTLMTGAAAIPANLYGESSLYGENGVGIIGNVMTILSVPGGLMGFNPTIDSDGSIQTQKSLSDFNKTALPLFYGGAIWGTIIANLWADRAALPPQLRPSTWTAGAQVPPPTK